MWEHPQLCTLTNEEGYRERSRKADKSAVGAINRPLRSSGYFVKTHYWGTKPHVSRCYSL